MADYSAKSGSYLPDVHRTLPHSEDAEKGVLGSMVLSPMEIIPIARALLKKESFHIPAHAMIFQQLKNLYAQKKRIDFITLTAAMTDAGLIQAVNGPGFITDMFTFVPTAANADYYIAIVLEKETCRRAIIEAQDLIAHAYDQQDDLPGLLKKARNIAAIGSGATVNQSRTEEAIAGIHEKIAARKIGAEGAMGIVTGVPAWDIALKGIYRGRFNVLGARPKVGKSALIEQAMGTQIEQEIPVLCFQQDMSVDDMIGRMACRACGMIYDQFISGDLEPAELDIIGRAADRLDPRLLRLYSHTTLTADEMAAIIEREKRENGIQVFYLDLFQRLKVNTRDKVEGLVDAANTIRSVIQETGVSGVVLAEILKEADTTKRPHSGQFKYCDGLFSSCDTSIMLWSDDDPKKLADITGELRRQHIIFTVDANRGGGVGDNTMYFDRPLMTFFRHASED
jgi:replicative DNA helicase